MSSSSTEVNTCPLLSSHMLAMWFASSGPHARRGCKLPQHVQPALRSHASPAAVCRLSYLGMPAWGSGVHLAAHL